MKMLYYDRIDVTEGIDVNKTSASKGCGVYHYWDFLNYSFQMFINGTMLLNIKGSDYCCIISLISKNEVIELFQSAD